MMRLAVLGSTRGTNLTAIIDAIRGQRLHASIELVFSNKQDALILERAAHYQLKTAFLSAQGKTRDTYDEEVSVLLKKHHIDLIVLIGYMRILSHAFVREWKNKIINVHPSLLPDFAGLMDLSVHEAVIDAGKTETGCTVHYVTEEVDAGPIVLQKRCPVLPADTPETVKQRVQALEGEALVAALKQFSA